MHKLILTAFLISLLFGLAPSSLLRAATSLQMTAQPAFGGRFKFGEWLPIFVNLENSGPDLTGEIQVSVPSPSGPLNFALPAELPTGARKQFTLYILPNNFSHSARVDFMAADPGSGGEPNGPALLTQELELGVVPNDRYVIGAVMANPVGLAVINPPQLQGRRERADIISLSLAELPDRHEGLRLLNALILNDVDTGILTPAQRTALSQWVARGGRLVLGGGVGAERTLAGMPSELQPATVIDQQQLLALPGLEEFGGQPIRVPGPFLITNAQPGPDTAILVNEAGVSEESAPGSLPGLPLIIERSYGAGYIDFIALDLSQSPFDAWAGVTPFAEKLLSPGAAWPDYLPTDVAPQQATDGQMNFALNNLPSLDLPSIRFLGFLLAGYIILVGPVNYLILRWRDRLAWAWVTIPALTLTFAGLAYWFGFSLRGGDIIVNQVTIKEMDSADRTTRSQTYVGLFSPRRQSYNIEVATDALLRPLGQGGYDPWSGIPGPSGSVRIVQGQPARIQGLTVDQWSMQSFAAETIPNDSPGLVAHLTAGRDSVHGQVINQSSDTWQDVVVVFYTRFQKLGDLAPGQAAEISLNFEDSGSVVNFNSYMLYQDDFNQANGPSREINFKQAVLDYTIFNSNRPELSDSPILIAWQKGGNPLEIGLEGYRIDTRQTTLLFGPLGLTFEGTQVTVPPGFSHLEVVSTTGNASTCSYGGGTVGAYVYQGTLETKLSLPKNVRQVQPDHLDLHIRTDGSWQELPNIELYDQTNGAWVFLEGAVQGPNPIPDTARFYNRDDASMQVRISNSDIAGGCLFLELALEGERL